jgi:hypothetical protein
MSLYLPEQKLGSHSSEGGSSNKFVLKGRQTGAMHRGHTWVFRAESHETMMAWYEDIKALTEKSPEERSNFVRVHSRSYSRSSQRSMSSDGVVDDDDDDDEPFAAASSVPHQSNQELTPRRPSPGGRFPSDVQVNAQRGLQAPMSPISVSPGLNEHHHHEMAVASGAIPREIFEQDNRTGYYPSIGSESDSTAHTPMDQVPPGAAIMHMQPEEGGVNLYANVSEADQAGFAAGQRDSMNKDSRLLSGLVRDVRLDSTGMAAMDTADSENSGTFHGQSLRQQQAWSAAKPAWMHNHSISAADPNNGKTSPSINGNAAHAGAMVRPKEGTTRTDNVPTISNLHIPGEYPKGTPTA